MEDKPEIRQENGERNAARHAIIRDQCEAGTAHDTRINLKRRNIAKSQRQPAVNASGAATSPGKGKIMDAAVFVGGASRRTARTRSTVRHAAG